MGWVRFSLGCLAAILVQASARAQAVVEYAAKAAGSAISSAGSSGGAAHLGACRVDSSVVSCLQHYYPEKFELSLLLFVLAVTTFMVVRQTVRTR